MTTIKDIARLAGVSVSTASLALNNKTGVSKATRQRVLAAAEQLRYIPNSSARSLITRRSNRIGLVVTDITNPCFGMLTKEISTWARNSGYDLQIGLSDDLMALEKSAVERLMEERVEGIVLVPTIQSEYDLSHLYKLSTHGIPMVFTTAAYNGLSKDCVMCDMGKGTYLLTQHLLRSGHRRIFMIAGSQRAMYSSMRIEGCKRAFAEANLPFSDGWIIESTPTWSGGYEAAQRIVRDLPDAIMTVNDVMAMGVLKYLKEHHIRVPQDVSVAGYDDLDYTCILETPLTTVRQPVGDIARRTIECLVARIQGSQQPEQTYYVDPILKIRDTTAPRTSDAPVHRKNIP